MYIRPELLDCRPVDFYTQSPWEDFQSWFNSEGDIDDFIFFEEVDKVHSEK